MRPQVHRCFGRPEMRARWSFHCERSDWCPSSTTRARRDGLPTSSLARAPRTATNPGRHGRPRPAYRRHGPELAEQIGMDAEFCERISHAAPLHDVGKVAIPDSILLKPGPLTPDERAIVETHTEEGYRLLRGSSSAILEMAATIALSHQERWDGGGYPRGLAGEAIPLEGRIVAIADVFDALTSDRVYRKAFPVDEAMRILREQRGKHFDPVLLDAFMEVLGRSGPDARAQVRADPAAVAE